MHTHTHTDTHIHTHTHTHTELTLSDCDVDLGICSPSTVSAVPDAAVLSSILVVHVAYNQPKTEGASDDLGITVGVGAVENDSIPQEEGGARADG